VGEVGDAIPT